MAYQRAKWKYVIECEGQYIADPDSEDAEELWTHDIHAAHWFSRSSDANRKWESICDRFNMMLLAQVRRLYVS